jgi:hypothetical protein
MYKHSPVGAFIRVSFRMAVTDINRTTLIVALLSQEISHKRQIKPLLVRAILVALAFQKVPYKSQ